MTDFDFQAIAAAVLLEAWCTRREQCAVGGALAGVARGLRRKAATLPPFDAAIPFDGAVALQASRVVTESMARMLEQQSDAYAHLTGARRRSEAADTVH